MTFLPLPLLFPSFRETVSLSIQAGLEFTVLLPQPPEWLGSQASPTALSLLIYSTLHSYLCSFKHLPLVEDFHGVNSFSVLHFDDSNL